jgi:tetratricopeptide (TPR) repeat protein
VPRRDEPPTPLSAARALRAAGRVEEALEAGLRAVRASRDDPRPAARAAALSEVATIELARGRPAVAAELFGEAAAQLEPAGPDRGAWLAARVAAAGARAATGRLETARAELRELVTAHQGEHAAARSRVEALGHLAALEPADRAAAGLDDALTRPWAAGDLGLLAERARAELRAGRPGPAADRYRALVPRLGDCVDDALVARVWLGFARALRGAGALDEAADALARAAAHATAAEAQEVADEKVLLAVERGGPAGRAALRQAVSDRAGRELRPELRAVVMREAATHGRWAEYDDHAEGAWTPAGWSPDPALADEVARTAAAVARRDAPASGREVRLLAPLVASHAPSRERVGALGASGAPVPAGPFDLVAPLGAGAMGVVWRARHHRYGVEVAVKVLTARGAAQSQVALFEAEIRAAAGLFHPNLVRPLDAGRVDLAAEVASRGALRSGTPWFAMELVAGRPLTDHCGKLAWPAAGEVLSDLLAALGHAHARGVLHLDVKPPNVLVAEDGGRGRPTLTDFGLAGLRHLQRGKVAGSPWYMAPEQFDGDSAGLGPWTDLYGLGCMAVELVRGRPPFDFADPRLVRDAHRGARPPDVEGTAPVPAGFDRWVGRLLAKDPGGRFATAAEAAAGLRSLGVGRASPERASWFAVPSPPRPLPDADLQAAGAGLVALRRPPLVGRAAEQSACWAALREVVEEGQPRVLVVAGAPGSGRASLVRWLAETASEALGATTVVASDGAQGLRAAVRAWLARPGARDDSAAFAAAWAWAQGEGGLPAAAPALAHLLARAPGVVRVLAVLGEVDPGFDPLLRALAAEAGPVLVALRAPAGEGPRGDGARRLTLEPLAAADARRLVRSLLPLSSRVREGLIERAGGNPGLIVDTLDRLRDELVPGRRGLVLRRGRALTLPEGLLAAWRERLVTTVASLPPAALEVVTLAALLGPHASTPAFGVALDRRGLGEVLHAVLPALEDRRLVTREGDGVTVPVPEDVVRAVARDAGVSTVAAGAAAAALAQLGVDPAREGRLRLLADDPAGALAPLLAGARAALTGSEPRATVALLDERDVAAAKLGEPPGLPSLVLRAHAASLLGDRDGEERAVRSAEATLTPASPDADRGEVELRKGALAAGRLDLAASETHLGRAADLFSAAGSPRALVAMEGAANVARARGRLDAAARWLDRALAASPTEVARVTIELGLGAIRLQQGDRAAGRPLLERGFELARARGLSLPAANAALALGDDDRRHGDPEAAEAWYDRAFEVTTVPAIRGIALLDGAMAAIGAGRFDRAAERLARASRSTTSRFAWFAAIARLPLAARSSDDDAFRAAFTEATAALEVEGLGAEPDAGWCFEQAAALAARAGHPARSRELAEVALSLAGGHHPATSG